MSGAPEEPKGDHLGPPRVRRKRGLSLRLLLFNKGFNINVEGPPTENGSTADQIEMKPLENDNLLMDEQLKLRQQQSDSIKNNHLSPFEEPIQSQHPDNDFDHLHEFKSNLSVPTVLQLLPQLPQVPQIFVDNAPSIVEPVPLYIPYTPGSNRLSSRLTIDSLVRSIEEDFPTKSYFGTSRPKKFGRFTRWKNRIFGIKNRGHTINGRVIPLSINKSDSDRLYDHHFYDSYSKQYIDERVDEPYVNNVITSSKYSLLLFLPKQLKAQFSKLANCYFMVVAIMQMIPLWSTTGHYTTIIPLCIFILISIAREGFDDWKRHLNDKEENNKPTRFLQSLTPNSSSSNAFGNINDGLQISSEEDYTHSSSLRDSSLEITRGKWKHIKVGDIIKINDGEWVPSDVLLLLTSSETRDCFVETMALDGETNLKTKSPHPELSKLYSYPSGLRHNKMLFTVEDPNTDLYNFEGSFDLNGEVYALGSENVIYRGLILRNTQLVLGLVIFTGEETKIRMNNIKNPRVKAPKLQKNINYIVLFMVFVVMSLLAFLTMGQRLYYNEYKTKAWYLYGQDAGVAATFMGFIIMYNTLIPLSLYVTMEIIKVMQLFFLQFDIDMYHVESNTPADAKTATILEELGQVSYVFSDKTGTLTDNKMLFRKFSVCGVSWLHDLDVQLDSTLSNELPVSIGEQFPLTDSTAQNTTQLARDLIDVNRVASIGSGTRHWKSLADPQKEQQDNPSMELLKYVQTHPQSLFAKKTKFFLLSIALCNVAIPKKHKSAADSSENSRFNSRRLSSVSLIQDDETDDLDISYLAALPDEVALVQAARDLGYVVMDRRNKTLHLKTYPQGFDQPPKFEDYTVLDVVDFLLARKRMSVVVKFPDGRIGLITKGADNVILERMKEKELALETARDISRSTDARKAAEADTVIQHRMLEDLENNGRQLFHLRREFSMDENRMNLIDNYLMGGSGDGEATQIADQARKELKRAQSKKYSLGTENAIPPDKLLVNNSFLLERTLLHVEEFSTEGLRTLLYGFKWLDKLTFDLWSKDYSAAKVALQDRSAKVEEVGGQIEDNLELLGATAIEDKLQDGVPEAIEKLRRAGIKMWMLTGDKRETAVNIGYLCRLIKDYLTVVVLTIEEGREGLMQRITLAGLEIQNRNVAHCVVVIDGATLTDIESDSALMSIFIELCVQVDSAIVCRALPLQKAMMVSSVRKLKPREVTLAIGDGANDIAMIQSADIGVGITGKEGLQAARLSDYAIAQFRYLLKLLLVHGRYNYVRTSKFVLCTFYKELLFYLTQTIYQRHTLFSGLSLYESWSLSMFNTLFTSLPVIVIGMFDKDLHPSTLLAVPELYAKGRLYRGFNLKIFVWWMVLATSQSIFLSFMLVQIWGDNALRDNTTFPLGNLLFAVLVIVINAKCEFIEMQNRQWLAFASFIIMVGGYALWNVLIMMLYRTGHHTIFYVSYGLSEFGLDQSWWATLLVLTAVLILIDILMKLFKFMIFPSDDSLFQVYEREWEMRRLFEMNSYSELEQGWNFPRDKLTTRMFFVKLFRRLFKLAPIEVEEQEIDINELQRLAERRKRAGTLPGANELLSPAGDLDSFNTARDVLPSGTRVRKASWWLMNKSEVDFDAMYAQRLEGSSVAQRSGRTKGSSEEDR